MDIYGYAMQMEKDGEQYYRTAATQVTHKGIRTILTMLADAETKHYHTFEQMSHSEKVRPKDSTALSEIKNIFLQMAESRDVSLLHSSDTGVYRKAQEIEQKTIDFYSGKAAEASDPQEQAIFLKVANEERKHYAILENIIGFVSKPEQWLENPEWYHLEEY